jgi:hypothetical protein
MANSNFPTSETAKYFIIHSGREIPGSGLPDQVSNVIIHHVTCKIFTALSQPGHMTAP